MGKKVKTVKRTSIAGMIIGILIVIALVATLANVMNYLALKGMESNVDQITQAGITNTELISDVRCTIEAIQKDFYGYTSTTDKMDVHETFKTSYDDNKLALEELMGRMSEEGWDEQVTQLETNLEEMYKSMKKIMAYTDLAEAVEDASAVTAQKISLLKSIQLTIADMNASLDQLEDLCKQQIPKDCKAIKNGGT